ncbi:MAG: ketol-acid reductoisomerase [Chloroflexota bacterium]|nr:MAG: ketol-acid reductoisomerase [Chloroflexota bacterium]
MATVYYDGDANLDCIRGRRIAIIGYGNQGRAHAHNLRDSGCEVRIGSRPEGTSWNHAESDGFPVQTVAASCAWADLVSLLLPDQHHRIVFQTAIRLHLTRGKLLLAAHGFSVQYGLIDPPPDVDVALVAPVGPGAMLRKLYLEGRGIPALLAVEQDATGDAREVALAYAAALGCTRVGVVHTTFTEETETDLFGEQAVLCGGLSALIRTGFETLVDAGYQPELAYFECLHQVKLIADLIYESGLAGMNAMISDTAEYGEYVSGPRIVDEHVRDQMRAVLRDIRDGTFARRWMAESDAGSPWLLKMRDDKSAHRSEEVGARLRALMREGVVS